MGEEELHCKFLKISMLQLKNSYIKTYVFQSMSCGSKVYSGRSAENLW